MTKPETPLHLLSTIADCLTVLVEHADTPPIHRAAFELMRDIAANVALDLQTERKEVAA